MKEHLSIRIITKIFEYAIFLAVAGMVIVLSVNVFLRYVVHHPFAWAEEISVLFTVWVVLLGAALVQKKDEHVAITYLYDSFPSRTKGTLLMVINLLVALVLLVHIFSGWNLFKLQMKTSMLGVDLPMGLFALAILAGMTGMFLMTLHLIFRSFKKRRASKQAPM